MKPIITLADKQMELIEGEIYKARQASSRGKPGIVLAQISISGDMYVGFVNHEKGKQIQAINGVEVGKKGYV